MENRICLVCSVSISATHLGIDVCRACASFFKRTTLAGRSYTCRQSDGQCTFRKHEKFMCRSCRHGRCIEVGMEYVEPPKRRPRKKKEEAEGETKPSMCHRATVLMSESIMSRMAEAYKSSHNRRLVLEQHYAAVNDLKVMGHPTEELYFVNITNFYEILRITIKESRKIIEHVFDEYIELPSNHKAILFKNFFGRFCFVEALCLSSRYFKNNFNFMTSLITCVDSSNVDEWVTQQDVVERKDDLRMSIKGFADEYNDLIVPLMKMDELTEREFHALVVLAFCDIDPDLPLPVEIFDYAEKTRLQVFEEMQDYYRKDQKLKDFSERLGNLIMVSHAAGEAGIMMCEELRMYATIFDVYANDRLICETFFG